MVQQLINSFTQVIVLLAVGAVISRLTLLVNAIAKCIKEWHKRQYVY